MCEESSIIGTDEKVPWHFCPPTMEESTCLYGLHIDFSPGTGYKDNAYDEYRPEREYVGQIA